MHKREEIGERIRKIRIQKGLTQENLAEKLNTIQNSGKGGNPQTISRIENAVNDYRMDTFLAVAEALEVNPICLLTENETPQKTNEKYLIMHDAKHEEEYFKCMMNVLEQLLVVLRNN